MELAGISWWPPARSTTPAVPLWYRLLRPMRPDRPRTRTHRTVWTPTDTSTPAACRLGAERSRVQIAPPRLQGRRPLRPPRPQTSCRASWRQKRPAAPASGPVVSDLAAGSRVLQERVGSAQRFRSSSGAQASSTRSPARPSGRVGTAPCPASRGRARFRAEYRLRTKAVPSGRPTPGCSHVVRGGRLYEPIETPPFAQSGSAALQGSDICRGRGPVQPGRCRRRFVYRGAGPYATHPDDYVAMVLAFISRGPMF
jgi:hypothetical protein